MPGIELTRLRNQVKELVTHLSNPESFLIHLEKILKYYQNLTLKNEIRKNPANISSYNSPRQVISIIVNEVNKTAIDNPQSALALANHLWDEPILETKILAIHIFRKLPSAQALPILLNFPDMFQEIQGYEDYLPLMTRTLLKLREDSPQDFNNLITSWLKSRNMNSRGWGIKILANLVDEHEFDDLPFVFEALKPVLLSLDKSLVDDLENCLSYMILASPGETEFFLLDAINDINDPNIIRSFLRISRILPTNQNKKLRLLLKSKLDHLNKEKFY